MASKAKNFLLRVRKMSSSKKKSIARISCRKEGVSTLFICILFGCLILPAMALFTFEVVRASSVKDQLRAICEASALAGAASMASSDLTDLNQTHQVAIDASLNTFKDNSIFEKKLANAARSYSKDQQPDANATLMYIELLDPVGPPPNSQVAFGDSRGRIVHVIASYGLTPVFGGFLGISGPFTIRADAYGRVPQLDLVLCFDISGSIDDQTPVTFVKRYWDTTNKRIIYKLTNARAGAPTTGLMASGKLFDILGAPPEGTGVNAVPPQNLDNSSSSSHSRRLTFSPTLRGSPNAGSPPGNYPNSTSIGDNYTYTDLIVNISENPDYTLNVPFLSSGGFFYPSMEAVVEAARGNLENGSVYSNARLDTVPSLTSITPMPGYQADYRACAQKKIRPLSQAQDAALNFYTIMNNNTEAHFGLVCFSSDSGSSPTETVSGPNVASNYSAGGNGQFPRPGVSLNKDVSNFASVTNSVAITVANGGTNIGDALYTAKDMIVNQKRIGSKRAIILFTDGQPTEPGYNPSSYARTAAGAVRDQGIPIYTIGLAQNSSIIPGEVNTLNDDPNKPVTYVNESGQTMTYTPGTSYPGVSYIAGNGGKFFLVTDATKLRKTFENIARSLVQLEKVNTSE